MIKNNLESISNSIKCVSCEKEGHKLESVLVKTKTGYRTLKFCICCGSPSIRRNLDCIDDQNRAIDFSNKSCLAIKNYNSVIFI